MMVLGIVALAVPSGLELYRTGTGGGGSALTWDDELLTMLYYVCWGVGRGVYESTFRSLCASRRGRTETPHGPPRDPLCINFTKS